MHSTLRPHAHGMEHKVGNVGLLPLVHHVVMFVNMKNVRSFDALCLASLHPSGKGVIVSFHNYRYGTAGPIEKFPRHRVGSAISLK